MADETQALTACEALIHARTNATHFGGIYSAASIPPYVHTLDRLLEPLRSEYTRLIRSSDAEIRVGSIVHRQRNSQSAWMASWRVSEARNKRRLLLGSKRIYTVVGHAGRLAGVYSMILWRSETVEEIEGAIFALQLLCPMRVRVYDVRNLPK